MTWGPYKSRVVKIHDGDTITFDIDLGFDHLISGLAWDGSPRLSCRIWGINAPELSTQAGKDALAYLQTILRVGDVCSVVSHGWDKYGGRFDGTVTLIPTGGDVGTMMLESGHAVVMA